MLGMEYIEGWSVREILGGGAEGEVEMEEEEEGDVEEGEEEIDEASGSGLDKLSLAYDTDFSESEGMKELARRGVTRGKFSWLMFSRS